MADKGYTYNAESSVKKEGAYECFIEKMEIGETQSGVKRVNITFRIRSDVEQAYKGAVIYDTIWREKENPDFFDRKKVNRLLGTQNVKEGTTFSSIDEIVGFLTNKFLQVNLGVRFSEYSGKDENVVKFYSSSKVVAQTFATNETIEITEEDLPF
ncbi:DUF669 domain-containing protein [bacterium]|nr:DUF669 domain-containing protein [bacterium]